MGGFTRRLRELDETTAHREPMALPPRVARVAGVLAALALTLTAIGLPAHTAWADDATSPVDFGVIAETIPADDAESVADESAGAQPDPEQSDDIPVDEECEEYEPETQPDEDDAEPTSEPSETVEATEPQSTPTPVETEPTEPDNDGSGTADPAISAELDATDTTATESASPEPVESASPRTCKTTTATATPEPTASETENVAEPQSTTTATEADDNPTSTNTTTPTEATTPAPTGVTSSLPSLRLFNGPRRAPAACSQQSTSGTVTWCLAADGTLTFSPTSGNSGKFGTRGGGWPWLAYASSITNVKFEGTINADADMGSMFLNCSNMTSINLTGFKIAGNGTWSLYAMFQGCTSLKQVDLGVITDATDNLTNTQNMFYGCTSLESVSGLDKLKFIVDDYSASDYMFYGCEKLKTLDLTGMDVSNVKTMSNMFYGCTSLESITFGSTWDTGSATTFENMFYHCESLVSLDLTGFKTSSATTMKDMFNGCKKLGSTVTKDGVTTTGSITFPETWDTSNVTDMSNMFYDCAGLQSIDLARFDTAKVTQMMYMFYGCSSLTSISIPFNTQSVWNMTGMFQDCSSLESVTFGGSWTTADVTTMEDMFHGCSELTTIDLNRFNTSNVQVMNSMFNGCSKLGTATTVDISGFDFDKVTSMWGMFNGDYGMKAVKLPASWAPGSKAAAGTTVNMGAMFYNCMGLESLDLSGLDTSRAATFTDTMFPQGSAGVDGTTRYSALREVKLGTTFSFTTPTVNLLPTPWFKNQWQNMQEQSHGRWVWHDTAGNPTSLALTAQKLASDYANNIATYAGTWKWVGTYTIKFDANGGTGTIDDMTGVGTEYVFQLPPNATITRFGYIFTGWKASVEGEDDTYDGKTYQDGQWNVSSLAPGGKTAVLKAQWTAASYTVTIPTAITYTVSIGSINVPSEAYNVTVAGTIPSGEVVRIKRENDSELDTAVGVTLPTGEGLVATIAYDNKTDWSSDECAASGGTSNSETVTITGKVNTATTLTGAVKYSASLEDAQTTTSGS